MFSSDSWYSKNIEHYQFDINVISTEGSIQYFQFVFTRNKLLHYCAYNRKKTQLPCFKENSVNIGQNAFFISVDIRENMR